MYTYNTIILYEGVIMVIENDELEINMVTSYDRLNPKSMTSK